MDEKTFISEEKVSLQVKINEYAILESSIPKKVSLLELQSIMHMIKTLFKTTDTSLSENMPIKRSYVRRNKEQETTVSAPEQSLLPTKRYGARYTLEQRNFVITNYFVQRKKIPVIHAEFEKKFNMRVKKKVLWNILDYFKKTNVQKYNEYKRNKQ